MRAEWTTEGISETEQFAYWREAVCDAFGPVRPEGRLSRFRGRIHGALLRSVHATTVEADPHPVQLTRQGISRQKDVCFFANLLLEGDVFVDQFGEQARIRPGDIYLLDTASTFNVTFASRFRIFCITMPDELLRQRLGALGRPAVSVLRGDAGAGQIAALYMSALNSIEPEELSDMQDLASEHLSALIARAVSRAPADGRRRTRSGHRAALNRILAYIDAHLAEEDLSPASACKDLGMSRSYLYQVLAESGHSFAEYVRNRRLEGCRRAIQSNPSSSISDIAARWGFPNQSSFSRMFKAHFGRTPRAFRG